MVVAIGFFGSACAVPDAPSGIDGTPSVGVAHGPCTEGDVRSCHAVVGIQNGVTTCFNGSQTCEDALWGPCEEGLVSNFKTFAAPQTECQNNPCNPDCEVFDEDLPGGAWTANGSAPSFNWQTGAVAGVSPDVAAKAWNEPCSTAADCQMDAYCFDPNSESCSHDICTTGVGLKKGCGTCADLVCEQHPKCCEKEYAGATCRHSECDAGPRLALGCSDCADAVCAARPDCCTKRWKKACVDLAKTIGGACVGHCDQPCSGEGTCTHSVCKTGKKLNPACDPCVADVCSKRSKCCTKAWNGKCRSIAAKSNACVTNGGPGSAVCSHDPCEPGAALTRGCADHVTKVCDAKASCCDSFWGPGCAALYSGLTAGGCPSSWAGDWSQTCIDAVATSCGATCATPPTGSGECVLYQPGEKVAACNGVNLTVGLTCDNTVPICNHGTQPAPAGVTVVHVPKDSGYFGDSDPPANMTGLQSCTTTQPIPAGECVNVSCSGLSAGREIMVNPADGNAGHVSECIDLDNWGVYSPGACGLPTCASKKVKANLKPVNMFITVDKSGSMRGSRWNNTEKAFNSFFRDPDAAGLRVALEFFPHSGCYKKSSECGNPTPCSDPWVPLGELAATSAPTDAQEAALIKGFDHFSPGGMTPAILALQGCHAWAKTKSLAAPGEQQVCVLVTDGAPNSCGSATGPFVTAAANGYNAHGVLTYGIGIVGAKQKLLEDVAAAGGGKAFFVGSANVEGDLLQALLAIRGDTLGCTVELPSGTYDPTLAIVSFAPTSGSEVTWPHVASSATCGANDGWYLDDPANPKNIKLCPTSCTTAQADLTGEIDFTFPCSGQLGVTTYTEVYEAVCPAGKTVQWGYFAYDTTTPNDSNVLFEARWADQQVELGSASFKSLATAAAGPPDTQTCPLASGAPSCAVDLFAASEGPPDAHRKWIELKATLNPDTGLTAGPTVSSYDLTFTCVDLL